MAYVSIKALRKLPPNYFGESPSRGKPGRYIWLKLPHTGDLAWNWLADDERLTVDQWERLSPKDREAIPRHQWPEGLDNPPA